MSQLYCGNQLWKPRMSQLYSFVWFVNMQHLNRMFGSCSVLQPRLNFVMHVQILKSTHNDIYFWNVSRNQFATNSNGAWNRNVGTQYTLPQGTMQMIINRVKQNPIHLSGALIISMHPPDFLSPPKNNVMRIIIWGVYFGQMDTHRLWVLWMHLNAHWCTRARLMFTNYW